MRVLVADDDSVSRHLVTHVLRQHDYEPIVANDGLQAWQVLQAKDHPRLAILDWMMPGMNGPEICRRVRERHSTPYVYTLLLTSRASQEDIAAGFGMGVDDYLTKPFNAAELILRVRVGARILRLEDALLETQSELRHRASHDALTGALNHEQILIGLEHELSRARREQIPTAAIMLDLDHFKRVNDVHGHQAGDEVLRQTSERIRQALRGHDLTGRYGGEEFLVVLPHAGIDDALDVAERLRYAISATPIRANDVELTVTASLGVAGCATHEVRTASELIGACDRALYRAKRAGRDRVEVAGAQLHAA